MLDAFLYRFGGKTERNHVVDQAIDRFVQTTPAFNIRKPLPRRGNVETHALPRIQPTLCDELGIRLDHRIGIDGQLLSKTAHTWQLLAMSDLSRGNAHTHRIDDLTDDRTSISGRDLNHQGSHTRHISHPIDLY